MPERERPPSRAGNAHACSPAVATTAATRGATGALASTWSAALASLGGADPGGRVLAAVCDGYSEAHRRYHDRRHLRAVVTTVADETGSSSGDDGAHLVLAAFYHDVVYDPRRDDNEAVSATRARDELVACGVGVADAARVAEAVMSTAHLADAAVAPPGNGPLLDADLAVLGSAPGRYLRYAADVRAEYAHVGDDDWRTGRTAVLRHLQEQALFVTPWGRARYEPAARDNLRWELDELAAGRVPGWWAVAPGRADLSRCGDRPPGGAS